MQNIADLDFRSEKREVHGIGGEMGALNFPFYVQPEDERPAGYYTTSDEVVLSSSLVKGGMSEGRMGHGCSVLGAYDPDKQRALMMHSSRSSKVYDNDARKVARSFDNFAQEFDVDLEAANYVVLTSFEDITDHLDGAIDEERIHTLDTGEEGRVIADPAYERTLVSKGPDPEYSKSEPTAKAPIH